MKDASSSVPRGVEVDPRLGDFGAALAHLLRPLARIMLRHGMTAHEFTSIADAAFVAAARDLLTEQGKEPNFSRISSLTGLHRHAVSAISGADQPEHAAGLATKHYQRNRLARVLSGWFENPDYTNADGRPRVLAFDGPAPSFTSLVRQYSGDIYAKIILDELLRVKAVRLTRDGMVRAVSRRFSTGGADPEALQHLGDTTHDLLSTLERNLTAAPEDRLFEDTAVTLNLPPDVVPLLRQLVARRGASFLQDMEGWLTQHERSPREVAKGQPTVRAGVALYIFTDPPSEDETGNNRRG